MRRAVVVVRPSTIPAGTQGVGLTMSDAALAVRVHIIVRAMHWSCIRVGIAAVLNTSILKVWLNRVEFWLNQPLVGGFLDRGLMDVKHCVRRKDVCLCEFIVTYLRSMEGVGSTDRRKAHYSVV